METILDEMKSEHRVKVARDLVQHTYIKNKPLYDRAYALVEKLGLGGLWQGRALAMAETILALEAD